MNKVIVDSQRSQGSRSRSICRQHERSVELRDLPNGHARLRRRHVRVLRVCARQLHEQQRQPSLRPVRSGAPLRSMCAAARLDVRACACHACCDAGLRAPMQTQWARHSASRVPRVDTPRARARLHACCARPASTRTRTAASRACRVRRCVRAQTGDAIATLTSFSRRPGLDHQPERGHRVLRLVLSGRHVQRRPELDCLLGVSGRNVRQLQRQRRLRGVSSGRRLARVHRPVTPCCGDDSVVAGMLFARRAPWRTRRALPHVWRARSVAPAGPAGLRAPCAPWGCLRAATAPWSARAECGPVSRAVAAPWRRVSFLN